MALGRTLAEVLALGEAEVNVWRAYRQRKGFPADRLRYGIANAGAYVGATWGGKARPAELLARFVAPATTAADVAAVKAWFGKRARKE